jgi:hypothetical protein
MRAVRALTVISMLIVAPSLIGCGQSGKPAKTTPASGVSPAPAATSSPRSYEVVAPVLYLRRVGRPMACLNVLLSLPPAGCGGVPVRGYDFERSDGLVRFGAMGWQTPPLHIVGTWDGRALAVTSVAAASRSAEAQPDAPKACDGSRTTPSSRRLAAAITRDHRRLHLLALQPCRTTVWVLVAVADRPTVSIIRRQFGARVMISGWLRAA